MIREILYLNKVHILDISLHDCMSGEMKPCEFLTACVYMCTCVRVPLLIALYCHIVRRLLEEYTSARHASVMDSKEIEIVSHRECVGQKLEVDINHRKCVGQKLYVETINHKNVLDRSLK